jgi:hypothetical protein
MARLFAFQRQMGLLHDRTVHVNVIGGSGSNLVKGAAARGTIIRGPGTGTSDTAGVWALSNGEAVIPAKAVSANRGLVHSLIAAGRGMASGGYTTVRGKNGHAADHPDRSGSGYSSQQRLIVEARPKAPSTSPRCRRGRRPPSATSGLPDTEVLRR